MQHVSEEEILRVGSGSRVENVDFRTPTMDISLILLQYQRSHPISKFSPTLQKLETMTEQRSSSSSSRDKEQPLTSDGGLTKIVRTQPGYRVRRDAFLHLHCAPAPCTNTNIYTYTCYCTNTNTNTNTYIYI